MNNQELHWMIEAYKEARNSPDPSTQNGALILAQDWENYEPEETLILGRASNTFPEGVKNTPDRLERPLKYSMVEHAERGAIYNAAKKGNCTLRATMFVPWAACDSCSRAIICAGIREVVVHQDMMDQTPEHWKESIAIAFQMFEEAGIIVNRLVGKLNGPELRFNGKLWTP